MEEKKIHLFFASCFRFWVLFSVWSVAGVYLYVTPLLEMTEGLMGGGGGGGGGEEVETKEKKKKRK